MTRTISIVCIVIIAISLNSLMSDGYQNDDVIISSINVTVPIVDEVTEIPIVDEVTEIPVKCENTTVVAGEISIIEVIIPMNESKTYKYGEYEKFLDELPVCEYCNQCTSWARYTRLHAEEQGIRIGEITLVDTDRARVKRRLSSGHRINFFYNDNGDMVFIDNTVNMKKIIEGRDLHRHISETFGIELDRLSFRDKLINAPVDQNL